MKTIKSLSCFTVHHSVYQGQNGGGGGGEGGGLNMRGRDRLMGCCTV